MRGLMLRKGSHALKIAHAQRFANLSDPHWRRRVMLWLVVCLAFAVLLSLDRVHESLVEVLRAADLMVDDHRLLGALAFTLLSAVSAMLAFFSSTLLIPSAVFSFGLMGTVVLLWIGWILGGVMAFTIGKALRKPLGSRIRDLQERDSWWSRLGPELPLSVVMLIQLAFPSEIPGYLFGLLKVPLQRYLVALALAELPFAMAAVLVGEGIVEQRGWMLLGYAALSGTSMLCASWRLRALLGSGAAARLDRPAPE